MFGTQEADLLFHGQMIERTGPRTYKITKGAFTSCVQPTPRWQMVATTFVLNLDRHALLLNAVLKVKGVPVFYMPGMFYPIQEDGRATGFLMPTYGASRYQGSSLSNAFFWAINRSQDAHLLPRLVHAARRRRPRRRIPLRARQRNPGRLPLLSSQRTGGGNRLCGRHQDTGRETERRVPGTGPARPAGRLDGAGPDRLLHRHRRPSDLPHQRVSTPPTRAGPCRAT